MTELLKRARDMIARGDFSTGYCMCGSPVDGHAWWDGHSPVDDGDYYAGRLLEDIDAALKENA